VVGEIKYLKICALFDCGIKAVGQSLRVQCFAGIKIMRGWQAPKSPYQRAERMAEVRPV
jgi:hypothetical protein